MKHKKNLIKSAKARVTGTIPYCHGKVPHSRKLLSLCSNDCGQKQTLIIFVSVRSRVAEETADQAVHIAAS
jgi:hypothetical protein